MGGVILFLSGILNGLSLPWHIDTAFYAVLFFHLGNILKDDINGSVARLIRNKDIIVLIGSAFLYASFTLLRMFPYNTSKNDFCEEGLILMMNLIGIVILVSAARIIPGNRYLRFLGKNTLVLFFVHVPFVYYVYQVLARIINLQASIVDNSIVGLIYVYVITIILYPIVCLLNKSKILTGKGRVVEKMVYRKK